MTLAKWSQFSMTIFVSGTGEIKTMTRSFESPFKLSLIFNHLRLITKKHIGTMFFSFRLHLCAACSSIKFLVSWAFNIRIDMITLNKEQLFNGYLLLILAVEATKERERWMIQVRGGSCWCNSMLKNTSLQLIWCREKLVPVAILFLALQFPYFNRDPSTTKSSPVCTTKFSPETIELLVGFIG